MNTLKFPLSIQLNATRPIFLASICGKELICMLDTGAHVPIYCKTAKLFNMFIHDLQGVSPYKNIPLGGFGVGTEKAPLYNFETFTISDFNNTVSYSNCKVAVLDKPTIPCDLLLPISLFLKSTVILNYATIPQNLTIECSRDKYGVGYYNPKNSLYIFSQ